MRWSQAELGIIIVVVRHFVSSFNPEGTPDPLCDALLLPGTHSSNHDDKQDHRPRSPSPPTLAQLRGGGATGAMIDTACGGSVAIVMEPLWTPLGQKN